MKPEQVPEELLSLLPGLLIAYLLVTIACLVAHVLLRRFSRWESKFPVEIEGADYPFYPKMNLLTQEGKEVKK